MSFKHRRGVTAQLAVFLCALLALFCVPVAHADPSVAETLEVSGSVDEDGTLHVNQKLTFADAAPDITQRIENTLPAYDYANYVFDIFDVSATADGTDLGAEVSEDEGYTVIQVSGSKAGKKPIEISYSVRGAAFKGERVEGSDPLTTVNWRVVQGLSVGAKKVTGEVSTGRALVADVDCQAGAPAALVSCDTFAASTYQSRYPSFTNRALGAGQVVQLEFKLKESIVKPNEVLEEEWTLDRAFSANMPYSLVALAVALAGAGALLLLHWHRGRDNNRDTEPALIAEFSPVAEGQVSFMLHEAVRPGMIGTLLDEQVDPVDVTATILDLAQRGHLLITELPREREFASTEWRLDRLEGSDHLLDYERELLDAIVPAGAAPVRLSALPKTISDSIEGVQDKLYEEVVKQGWFKSRPDQVRSGFQTVGVVTLIISLVTLGLLVAFTKYGLTGIAFVGFAIGLLFLAQVMPRRSAKGSAILRGLDLLSLQLQTQSTQMFGDDELKEYSKVLPYSVVLGSQDRWVNAFGKADDDPGVADPNDIDWYHGPANWQLQDLPASLDNFVTTLEGRLYSRG
ncbi:DUF2207 domain-containing protein [Propionimicrobium lymphophilum]|uniref:DUF2207 domain-containing protein n=1 Tax=Propionimicrobium lymphophilum TaxID=33012 RepID=UPI0023F3A053|nr:DUF2207 domain-containing protein [Propionimicrobium lymphophilum]